MKLSIVTTLYQSSSYINQFYERVTSIASKLTDSFEIVFVDDGSPDDSLDVAKKIVKDDSNVSLVELSRNYGHHRAMMAGLEQSRGDLVFLIDCDLEEPPESLELMWNKIHEESNNELIYGVNPEKKEGGVL